MGNTKAFALGKELAFAIDSSSIQHAIGTFTSSITLQFVPDAVWVSSSDDLGESYTMSAFLYPGVTLYFRIDSRTSDRIKKFIWSYSIH